MVIKAAAGAFFSGRKNKYTIGCFLQFIINRKINYLKPGKTSSLMTCDDIRYNMRQGKINFVVS